MMFESPEFDLSAELMREHSKRNISRVTRWVGDDALRFSMLMELVLNEEPVVARRASWVMSLSIEHYPSLAAPWLRSLLNLLSDDRVHSAVVRNAIRSLQFVEIPSRYRGIAVDRCIDLLRSVHSEIAVRAFAMTVLLNVVRNEPDLRGEVVLVIEPLLEFSSAGVRSRARKVLKALKSLRL